MLQRDARHAAKVDIEQKPINFAGRITAEISRGRRIFPSVGKPWVLGKYSTLLHMLGSSSATAIFHGRLSNFCLPSADGNVQSNHPHRKTHAGAPILVLKGRIPVATVAVALLQDQARPVLSAIDTASTSGLAVDSNLGWKGAEKYVATVPQGFDLWQDPQKRYHIFVNNFTERTWMGLVMGGEVKKIMKPTWSIRRTNCRAWAKRGRSRCRTMSGSSGFGRIGEGRRQRPMPTSN